MSFEAEIVLFKSAKIVFAIVEDMTVYLIEIIINWHYY